MKRSWRWCDFIFYFDTILVLIVPFLYSSYAIITSHNSNDFNHEHGHGHEQWIWTDGHYPSSMDNEEKLKIYESHLKERGFSDEQIQNMSTVGKLMLAPEGSPLPNANRIDGKFLILTWKFVQTFNYKQIYTLLDSQLKNCKVTNCHLAFKDEQLMKADAVIFPMNNIIDLSDLPLKRRQDQRWIFLINDIPHRIRHREYRLSDYNGIFNWSMTYRMDSDVPIPYGRTIKRKETLEITDDEYLKIKNKNSLVSIINMRCTCRDKRWSYVKKLKKYLGAHFHIIGPCKNSCTHICKNYPVEDCNALYNYKFHLSFEKENRSEYLTQNVFWNAYAKYAVPIISGPPKKDCDRLLPPNSFIHVDDFESAEKLAEYLVTMNNNATLYLSYHEWRSKYKVINEDGWYNSDQYYCRVCEALNYNSKDPKVYRSLEDF